MRSNEAIARAKIQTRAETSQGSPLRRVEPGSFVLGSSRAEPGRRANEVLVPATLTRPFFIGVHEVTIAEYSRFAKATGRKLPDLSSATGADNANFPMFFLSWNDALAYTK